jgi:tetratricopeptide (TPR) repeat protein
MSAARTAAFRLSLLPVLAAAAPAGSIIDIKGRGEYRQGRGVDWRPAVVKQPVFVDDYVRSLHQSYVTVLFSDGTQEKIGPNGQMNIRALAEEGKGSTLLELLFGRFWFRSKTPPRALEIRTPSASASVRGTEWQIDVGAEGDATLAVYAGEVEFFNEHGRVVVGANEQALAQRGRAPVKLAVRVSRERMQWVSAATVEPLAYAEIRAKSEPALSGIELLVAEGRLDEARARVMGSLESPSPPAVSFLLAADFAVYSGELDRATALLRRGAERFPQDARLDAALARIALLRDDPPAARAHVQSALAKSPRSPDALVMLGDLERHQGRAREALAAYSSATAAAPADARGWRGAGVVESERENVRRARASLLRALELDDSPGTRAELGTLAGFAGDLASARAELHRALEHEPANFVALTGLGIVELKAGDVPAALQALLAATAVEPRYARGHVYLAVAYYQAGREDAALESLRRAAELDAKDPLPHLMTALIHLDRIEPGHAVAAAREAQRRLPFTKSLNQLADDQKGIANVGAPLAFMGLEGRARSAAHDSYLPFWGASHLFLADRYPGEFDRRAELMQGFIADPLAFGGSNRFQSLVQAPGHHATIALRAARSAELSLREPVVTVAGMDTSRMPFAYFAEAIDTRVEPREAAIVARARTATVAAAGKPFHEAGFFVYANYLDLDEELGREGVTGVRSRIDSRAGRVDAGLRYAPGSQSMLMVKAGFGEEKGSEASATSIVLPSQLLLRRADFHMRPRRSDVAVRHIVADEALEVSWGAEAAQLRTPTTLQRDAVVHFAGTAAAQEFLDEHDRDRSATIYATARWQGGPWRIEGGLAWHRYEKDRDADVITVNGPVAIGESYRRNRAGPHLGLTWAGAQTRVRIGCRRWLRPAGLDTLAPVAVAAMPLDDQVVFAGGTLDQCRAQAQWSSDRLFASAHAERVEVRNLVSPLDGPQNAHLDVTNLDRLRNRTLAPSARPDQLEDLAIFGEGLARRAGIVAEAMVTPLFAARVEYLHTHSENTAAAFAGARLPYLPRHLVAVGTTWAPGHHLLVAVDGVRRSRRFVDEANGAALEAGWDAHARIYWETADKRWSVEAFGANLFRKAAAEVYGVTAAYRF